MQSRQCVVDVDPGRAYIERLQRFALTSMGAQSGAWRFSARIARSREFIS
jgi:hypothetical protein